MEETLTRTRHDRSSDAADRDNRAGTDEATRVKRADDGTRIDERTRVKSGGNDGDAGADPTRLRRDEAGSEIRGRTVAHPATTGNTGSETGQADFDRPDESLGIGSILRQRFRIEGILGEGGMGTVYSAVDLLKQEARDEEVHVALKVMKPDLVDAEMTFMGLQREARRAQQLAHPNIVTVYDFDRADGHVYMTMEFLRGRALSDLLKQNRHGVDPDLARDIIGQVAAGLAHAHEEGIVHVDLKPQNVFLLDSGRAKILDFGIARAWQQKRADRVEDAFSGYSPPYASPQIIERERPTPRDDVFALGIIAYALFTGRHPFDWTQADKARAGGLRPAADRVFKRGEWRAIRAALSFDAEARPADAGEFLKRFAPSRIKRAAIGVSVGSVAAAVAFVLLFQPQPGPEIPFDQLDPALQARIETELADAASFAELGDLDSALQLYQAVLTLHPGNRRATRGMSMAVERAIEQIGDRRQEGAISVAAARASLESMLAYEALPAQARERLEQAADSL